MARLQIAVVGAGECGEELRRAAYAVGEGLGGAGARLICGGRGGVMEAACRGARSAGGEAVGILPGSGAGDSPPNDAVGLAVFGFVPLKMLPFDNKNELSSPLSHCR